MSCSNCSNAVLLWGTLVQFGFKFPVSERSPLMGSSGKRTSLGALFGVLEVGFILVLSLGTKSFAVIIQIEPFQVANIQFLLETKN